MKSKNKFVEALRGVPLIFYVLSFIVISLTLLFNRETPDVAEFDRYAYKPNSCAATVVLLDYDFKDDYLDSLGILEKKDSLQKPYFKLPVNSKVKMQYEHEGLLKIAFFVGEEMKDGFMVMEYVHSDSCSHR